MAVKLTKPELYVEHLPETHRTINPDRTVSEVELPGFIAVGVEVSGVRKEIARFKAGGFLDDLARAKSSKSKPDESSADE